jgi:hypothetical protein
MSLYLVIKPYDGRALLEEDKRYLRINPFATKLVELIQDDCQTRNVV